MKKTLIPERHATFFSSLLLGTTFLLIGSASGSSDLSGDSNALTAEHPGQGSEEAGDVHDAKAGNTFIDWEGLERNAADVEPSPVEGLGEVVLEQGN